MIYKCNKAQGLVHRNTSLLNHRGIFHNNTGKYWFSICGNQQIAAVVLFPHKPFMHIITLFIRIDFASPPIYILHVSGKNKLEMQRIHMLVLQFALSTVLQILFWFLIDFIICLDAQETDFIMSSWESIFLYSISEMPRTKLKIFQKTPAM